MSIHVDTVELAKLSSLLAHAGVEATVKTEAALEVEAQTALAEARSTAAGYGGTGELAGDVGMDRGILTRRIVADVRQGHFLEAGTPTTGAPRDWATGPTERAQDRLLTEMGGIATEVF